MSWEPELWCGTVGKETGSWGDKQPFNPGCRREEMLWDLQQTSVLVCSKRVSLHLRAARGLHSINPPRRASTLVSCSCLPSAA